MTGYSASELMIVAAARALEGTHTVLVGVGLPNVACNLAKRTVAPGLELVYESGAYGSRPKRTPLSIGDPDLVSGATMIAPMADLFGYYLQGGRVDVAVLGTAQIDRYGNLNTTMIGEYPRPKVRLPGSGGACEMAIHARRTIIITRLERRVFVETLDFRTSPGYLEGGGGRADLGIPGGGPQVVVTDLAVFSFERSSGEMELHSVHPGVEAQEVMDRVGWDLRHPPSIDVTQPPSERELQVIREELDPQGLHR